MTRFLQGVIFTLSFLAFATFIYEGFTPAPPIDRGVSSPSFTAVAIKTVPFILLQGEGDEKQLDWKNTQ